MIQANILMMSSYAYHCLILRFKIILDVNEKRYSEFEKPINLNCFIIWNTSHGGGAIENYIES